MSIAYYFVTEHSGTGGQRVDYVTDRHAHPTRRAAFRAGIAEIGHDGFLIATVKDGQLIGYGNCEYDRCALAKALGLPRHIDCTQVCEKGD